jgi:hypothetical protein
MNKSERVDDGAAVRAARFGTLPEPVPPAQLVEEIPADPPTEPQFSGDHETAWMIRYSG